MPGIISMPGEGLACDIGMFMSTFCGEAPGEEVGIGMFMSIFCGEAPGDAAGVGMFISIFCCGEDCGFADAAGICIPGIVIFSF